MTARVLDPATLTRCPDCGSHAFGPSHDGNCLLAPINDRTVGAALIARYAKSHEVVSANELRDRWERQGLNPNGLSAALTRAVKAGVLRKSGHTPSLLGSTKRHDLVSYDSLIFKQS